MRELEEWRSWLDRQVTHHAKGADGSAEDRLATAVSRWMIDATLDADTRGLQAGLEALRDAYTRLPLAEAGNGGGRLKTIIMVLAETMQAGMERAWQARLAREAPEPDSWAAKMLIAIHRCPHQNNTQLSKELDTGETQVSRTGRVLIGHGLAVSHRRGRTNVWETTPRGAETVQRWLQMSREAD